MADSGSDSEIQETKGIQILGKNNRYQINKLTKQNNDIKMRKGINAQTMPAEFFVIEKQMELLSELYNQNMGWEYFKTVQTQLDSKLGGYKQQDILKKRLDESQFISLTHVVQLLHESEMTCHYCKEKMFLLYDIVREMKQWTLDRINNDIGHNVGNCLPACLDCNLKRRRTNKDSFLFTKQLNIVKTYF